MSDYKYEIRRVASPFGDYLGATNLCDPGRGAHRVDARLDHKRFDGGDGFEYSHGSLWYKFVSRVVSFAWKSLNEFEWDGDCATALLTAVLEDVEYVRDNAVNLFGEEPPAEARPSNSAIVAVYDAAAECKRGKLPRIECDEIALGGFLGRKCVVERFDDGVLSYEFLCEKGIEGEVRRKLESMSRRAYEYRIEAFDGNPKPSRPTLTYDPGSGLKLREFAAEALGVKPGEIYVNTRF